jgi:ABC-type Fe3+ transport system substrate-binding protein
VTRASTRRARLPLAGPILAGLLLSAPPAGAAEPAPEAAAHFGVAGAPGALTVRGTTDVALFGPLLEAFAQATPELEIRYEQWGSNDLYALTAAACRDRAGATGRAALPPADLILSSAADLQVKLVNDGCAQPHRSVLTAALPAALNWRDEIFGVTEEPAVIVYNRELVPPAEVPRSRFDLIDLLRPEDSRYTGRVATYDIEDSGLGYLFAFADSLQATTFGGLIEAFARSGAIATCCSAEIIEGVAEGRYLIAYNVLGSYALDRAEQDPRLGVLAPEDYTLALSRGAMIPKDAPNPTAAGLLIDFMLSEPGRAVLADQHLLAAPGLAPERETSLYRPIALSPTLLLGLDQQKRAGFLARWRAAFARR